MIIDILLPLSLAFIMFTLGLGLTLDDFKLVFTHPKAFAVGITNQMVVLPIVALMVIYAFGLSNEMAVGMMILACSPGGVSSNMLTKLAKGDVALSISYTAIVSIITVVSLPLIVGFAIISFMGSNAPQIDIVSLCLTMFLMTALPVALGVTIHHKYVDYANRVEPKFTKISTILFILIVLGALASEWDVFIQNLQTIGLGILALISLMLLIGYGSAQFFSMNKKQSITVGIESSVQNATVGIAVGNIIINTGDGLSILTFPSAVYGILMYMVCLPVIYIFVKKKG